MLRDSRAAGVCLAVGLLVASPALAEPTSADPHAHHHQGASELHENSPEGPDGPESDPQAGHETSHASGPHAHHGEGPPRPDAYAPIGVMGDHPHAAGEFMLSYRYMRMEMNRNRDGTNNISNDRVLRDYMVTPTRMITDMHMMGAMYAPTNWLTLMAMLPVVDKRMDHETRMGTTFTTKADGLGDFRLSVLGRLLQREGHTLVGNLGLSFPTGSIRKKDQTPMGRTRLPYPMQPGTGTYDLYPGFTYTGFAESFSWGGQAFGKIRMGRNSLDYRWGHELEMSAWSAYKLTPWMSLSTRLKFGAWGDIQGRDDKLNKNVVPTADPDLRAGERLDLLLGINFVNIWPNLLRGVRLAIEAGVPVYQRLDGPQLSNAYTLTVGLQQDF